MSPDEGSFHLRIVSCQQSRAFASKENFFLMNRNGLRFVQHLVDENSTGVALHHFLQLWRRLRTHPRYCRMFLVLGYEAADSLAIFTTTVVQCNPVLHYNFRSIILLLRKQAKINETLVL